MKHLFIRKAVHIEGPLNQRITFSYSYVTRRRSDVLWFALRQVRKSNRCHNKDLKIKIVDEERERESLHTDARDKMCQILGSRDISLSALRRLMKK
jgi:hypothetical protein